MTDQEVQLFLADLAIIILLARLLGMAAKRLGQPPVLGEIVAGRPGRTSPEQLTLYKSVGVAVEDDAAAALALRGAEELGLGTVVELDAYTGYQAARSRR